MSELFLKIIRNIAKIVKIVLDNIYSVLKTR